MAASGSVGRRRPWAGATVVLLLGIALLARLAWPPVDEAASQGAPQDHAKAVLAAAVARIAQESRRPQAPPVARAAPLPRDVADNAGARATAPPTPPDGYSFVDHFGEMAKGRIERGALGEPEEWGPAWLDAPDAVARLRARAAAAGRDWSFGWIRPAHGVGPSGLARALAGSGAEMVGSSGRLVRARLPVNPVRLRALAALDAVDALGAAPPEAKLLAFEDWTDTPGAGARPVFVTLMADDPDGRWRRAMEELGAVVGGYDPALRVYRANADRGVVEALAAADFVLAVEPIRLVQAAHDTAVPTLGADALRAHGDAPGIFSGAVGASVPIGVMDTGLNIHHLDIVSHRDSICGANFAYNSGWHGPAGPLVEDDDLWLDDFGHGTHVTGTLAGNGFVQERFAGMAPGVRHIRFAKVLDSFGAGFGDSMVEGMDFLARASRCADGGRMSARAKPLIVNMSLSAAARVFRGREVGARKLDSTVWSHRQLYVVAQSNAGIHGFSDYGAAKNSLAVGAVMDSGDLAVFSSHGPTADGRLAPNVVGAGVRVHSARGGGARGGYHAWDGTSMSSPAVAGIAALLMDAVPAHRERPALARARLMASAVRPDPWLDGGVAFPLDNTAGPGPLHARFGMGKVSARTAALQRDGPDGWTSGSATTELEDGEYGYVDIPVPEGASRLDIVMTWDEPPADAVASTVLNDLDLWLDRDADCESAACGEWVSRSRVDNVEWIVVRNPAAGTYRVKVLAHRVYTAAPRAAVAWTVIRGASTPTLSIEADRERVAGGGTHEITLTLTADAYVSAGTRLRADCRTGGSLTCNDLVTIESVALVRADGLTVSLADEQGVTAPPGYSWTTRPIDLGPPLPIGEVAAGDARQVVVLISVPDDPGEGARVHFTASAWNARSGSVSVDVGSTDEAAEVARPANDDFASATAIEGTEGSVALDPLLASSEPGEPVFQGRLGRPATSVWYAWTAPADGAFRFRVPVLASDYRDRDDIVRHDGVHVFTGDDIALLEEVASAQWGATFFAEEGATYRVRVSGLSRAAPVALRWSPGGRPVNDDFAEAVVLEGASGSVDGSSAGATLEPGEAFGGFTATTWFRWVAPSDGRWEFRAPARNVLAFEGDDVATLRLVGQRPASAVQFPAGAGREYRLAVAERGAAGLGGDYTLGWYSINRTGLGNDPFEAAESLGDESSSEHVLALDSDSTVEPGEPAETGVRTRWWTWEAPRDGLYTWRLRDVGEVVPSFPKMRVAVFSGVGFKDLELAAEIGPGAPHEALLDAVGGATYRIAAGFRNGDAAAYESYRASGELSWRTTPDNDRPENAAGLMGASGSVSGSTAFATGARGERSTVLGRSTLWWTYEAETSGWMRFAVDGSEGPWAVTVHRDAADGFGGLDVLASSVWQRSADGSVEVLFEAEEGVRYTVALGVRAGGRGGEFTLRWEEADAPAWLRYAGRLVDGGHDSAGDAVEIRGPRDLAMHGSGNALYLASDLGLQVFERDPVTGRLDHVQLLDTELGQRRGSLVWDASRDRLLVDDCGTWHVIEPGGNGPALEDLADLEVADDPGHCGEALLMDASGAHLYRVAAHGVDHFAVEDGGGLRFVSTTGASVTAAVLANDSRHLYATEPHRVLVFERDAESGALTQSDFEETITAPGSRPVPLAITDDDAYLFVFDNSGERAHVFSLADPTQPERLATLSKFWDAPYQSDRCRFADPRMEAPVVDVLCPGLAFTVRWDSEAAELEGADAITPSQTDRFNSAPMPDFDAPVDLAASPDGRHLYVATPAHGIVIFARDAGGNAEDRSGAPDLVIQHVWASPGAAFAGGPLRLGAVVRNRGGGGTDVTLRFYRSADTTVTTADGEVGSVSAGHLAASGTRGRSVDVTAPVQAGTYHYGACVDRVTGEADVTNNCSAAVSVTVMEGDPDLVVGAVSVDASVVDPAADLTLSAVVRNRGEGTSAATTLRYLRSDDAGVSPADVEVGIGAVGTLAPGAESEHSVAFPAAVDAGTAYYGVCVDTVSGESDTDNNCSTGIAVTVRKDGE